MNWVEKYELYYDEAIEHLMWLVSANSETVEDHEALYLDTSKFEVIDIHGDRVKRIGYIGDGLKCTYMNDTLGDISVLSLETIHKLIDHY